MLDNSVSRREFLKKAGIAGATLGAAGGLGGLLAACGGEDATTTTAAAATTILLQAARPRPPLPARPPQARAPAVETGREIKIGFVSPITGKLGELRRGRQVRRRALGTSIAKDGLVFGDSKNHPIKIILQDSQSEASRAAQVAGDLINNDKVDMMMVASTPGHHGAGVRPVRSVRRARASPTTPRGRPGSTAARAIPRSASSGPITASGVRKTSRNSTSPCGTSSPTTRSTAPSGRTTPTATPIASPGRPKLEDEGLQDLRPGRVRGRPRGLHQGHLHLQERRRRDLRRRALRPGLHQLLEAVQAAGLHSQSRDHRQSPAVLADGRRPWATSPTA